VKRIRIKYVPVLTECAWRLCNVMFLPKTKRSKYHCDACREHARYEREKNYGNKYREQHIKKQEDLKKLNKDKITVCTCPMCRETHEVIGIVKPPWKYCDNCDNNREQIMNGLSEDYGSSGFARMRKPSSL
jgi:hypothetical protein